MKPAILLLAVFICLSATSQQVINVKKTAFSDYVPVKFEPLKKFKSPNSTDLINTDNTAHSFTLVQPEKSVYNFKPLQQYLAEDMQYYRAQKSKESWTQFTSGILGSYQKQRWFDNKNNIQQRWMANKLKGK